MKSKSGKVKVLLKALSANSFLGGEYKMNKRKFYRILGVITILGVIAVWTFNVLAKQKYYYNRRNIKMIEKEYEFEDVYFGRMKAKFPKKVRSFSRWGSINGVEFLNFPWPNSKEDLNNQESDYHKGFSQKADGVGDEPHDSVKILAAPQRNDRGAPIGRPPGEPLDLTTKIGFLGNNDGRFTTEEDKYFVQKPNILPRDALYDAVFQDHIQRKILKKDDEEEDDSEIPLIVEERWYFNGRVKIIYFYKDRNDKTGLIAHAILHLSNGYGVWFSSDMLSFRADLSLENLERILKDIIKHFIDVREQIIFMDDARHYFFLGNNALVLPFNEDECFTTTIYDHKLFNSLGIETFYGAESDYSKGFFLNRLNSVDNRMMAMALNVSYVSLRAGERKVAGLDGEEILIKITGYKSQKNSIGFMWRYPGDLDHQQIKINMDIPGDISSGDLMKSIAMWDYILDSMVWFDKK